MNSYSVMTDLATAEGMASAALSASFPQSLGAVVGALDDPQTPARALDWMKQNYALASAALFACAQLCSRAAAALDDDAATQHPHHGPDQAPSAHAGSRQARPGKLPGKKKRGSRPITRARQCPDEAENL